MHGGNIHLIKRETDVKDHPLIDFSANINPLGIPPVLMELMKKALVNTQHYPDPDYHDLYESVAAHYGCSPEHLILGNGAAHVIHDVIHMLNPSHALLPEPTFSEYRSALVKTDTVITESWLDPAQNFRLPTNDLKKKITQGADLLVLCNPNNPNGRLINRHTLLDLLEWSKKYQCDVMVDEAFMEFVSDETEYTLLQDVAQWPNLTVIRTFTKIFAVPGLRLGAAITGATSLAAKIKNRMIPWSINSVAEGLHHYLGTPEAFHFIAETRKMVHNERQWLYNALSGIRGLTHIEGAANYILIQLQESSLTVETLRLQLISKGIIIRDCSDYNGLDASWFRIAVMNREQNSRLISSLRQLLGDR